MRDRIQRTCVICILEFRIRREKVAKNGANMKRGLENTRKGNIAHTHGNSSSKKTRHNLKETEYITEMLQQRGDPNCCFTAFVCLSSTSLLFIWLKNIIMSRQKMTPSPLYQQYKRKFRPSYYITIWLDLSFSFFFSPVESPAISWRNSPRCIYNIASLLN